MPQFQPFDLGAAYSTGENILRSQEIRQNATDRTQIERERLAAEQQKAAEQEAIGLLVYRADRGDPSAGLELAAKVSERDPNFAAWLQKDPKNATEAALDWAKQGLGLKEEAPKQVTLYSTEEGYLPADKAQGKMPYRASEKPAAPRQEPQTNWQRRTRTLPDGSIVEYDFNPRTREEVPVTGPAGAKPAPGKPAGGRPIKAESEKDKTVSVLFGSLIGAENDIAKMTGGTTTASRINAALPAIPLVGGAAGTLQSDAFRKYESAALRWAANLLYIKSGATAPPEEVRSTYKQFFPQPGDGPETLAQKEAARRQEMSNIMKTYPFLADRYTLPPAKPPPGAQTSQSPKTFKHPSGATVEILD